MDGGLFRGNGHPDRFPPIGHVVAEKDCILIAIHEIILRHINPELALKLYKNLTAIMAERIRKNNEQILELTVRLERSSGQKESTQISGTAPPMDQRI